ncbi:MAG: hypothetical protein IIC71_13055 [Acidobacteria bacterium]|nr:hypothetical protein [Acidobacteriota bacterium]
MHLPGRAAATLMTFALVAAACTFSGDTSETTTTRATGPATTTGEATSAEGSTTVTSPAGGLLLGLTAFPSQPSLKSAVTAFELAKEDGTLIAHHLDRGIPWEILLAAAPLPDGFTAQMAARRQQSEGRAVYVATAITNFARDEILGGLDGGARLPGQVDDIIGLYRQLYDHVKETYPDIVVFASFQAELGDPSVVAVPADATDIIAVSTYPYLSGDMSIPEDDYLDRFFDLGPPVAIAETGFPTGGAVVPQEGSQLRNACGQPVNEHHRSR